MVEVVVGLLIDKLGEALWSEAATECTSLLGTEYSALKGLFDEIRRAMSTLEFLMAFLQDMEKVKNTNKTTAVFIKKIREIAFRMEDVVDEFKCKFEDHKPGGFAAKMKRMQHVKVWHRLAIELRDINVDLENASKHWKFCGRTVLERYDGGNDHHVGLINPTSCFAREEDLVGIRDNAEKLKEWLLDSLNEKRRKIITVCGMPGIGKTTLVDHVYKTLKEDFDFAAWLTVSKNDDVNDLLKKIARDFGISIDAGNMDLRSLVEVIRNHLNCKRYILVLDDVWKNEVLVKVIHYLQSNGIGRFILTSRKREIESLATENCVIMLEPLKVHHSLELFCNLVFQIYDDRRCPFKLEDLAKKFVQQCEGLPLAIACIGRLLSFKPATYSAWKNVYEELELKRTSKHEIPGVDSILEVSLDDLSYELKNCFLHCAMFPEDYKIKRRRLFRHWITAGFIKKEGNKTLEEVAESYLNELVNRSLLQVTQKNEFGRVKCCRMHDIIRHLVLSRAEEECFGKVYEGSGFSKAVVRRLSIQSANISPLSHSDAKYIRAIYAFTRNLDVDLLRPILESSSLLSILDLHGSQVKVLPDNVFNLFNLRFLGIRFTGIEILPEAIGRLQNLEVLDALDTGLVSLPKGVSKLKKLRYMYASKMVTTEHFQSYGGVRVPRGIGNLTGLHALRLVKASLETLCDVAALTDLRTFEVSDVTSEHSSTLCAAIMNMSHLLHLGIAASDQNEILPLEALHLPETLSKLEFHGQLEKKWMPQILSSWSHLGNLAHLSLRWSKFDAHWFSRLQMLRSLCKLDMFEAYDGKELRFHVRSFPKLRELVIYGAPQLNQIEIEEGALEGLVVLWLSCCPELKGLPQGIEYLTALEQLYLRDTSEELVEKLRKKRDANEYNEELVKISHIRKVVVILTKENIWESIR